MSVLYENDLCLVWTEWTEWSSCSASCGYGTNERTRRCVDTNNGNAVIPPADCGGTDADLLDNKNCQSKFALNRYLEAISLASCRLF